jgi:hypothetical protein
MAETNTLDQESEETRRWRRVRDEINRRFKTVEALSDHLERLEKQARTKRAIRSATARARGKARSTARNAKPANGKPVHKA